MTGPLSLKQQREAAKFSNDERRKEELHQVKLAKEINKFAAESNDSNMAMPAVTGLSPLSVQRLDQMDTRVKGVRTDLAPLAQSPMVSREAVANVTPGGVYDSSGNPVLNGSGDAWRTADTVQQQGKPLLAKWGK
jgi:hypothetical protein